MTNSCHASRYRLKSSPTKASIAAARRTVEVSRATRQRRPRTRRVRGVRPGFRRSPRSRTARPSRSLPLDADQGSLVVVRPRQVAGDDRSAEGDRPGAAAQRSHSPASTSSRAAAAARPSRPGSSRDLVADPVEQRQRALDSGGRAVTFAPRLPVCSSRFRRREELLHVEPGYCVAGSRMSSSVIQPLSRRPGYGTSPPGGSGACSARLPPGGADSPSPE